MSKRLLPWAGLSLGPARLRPSVGVGLPLPHTVSPLLLDTSFTTVRWSTEQVNSVGLGLPLPPSPVLPGVSVGTGGSHVWVRGVGKNPSATLSFKPKYSENCLSSFCQFGVCRELTQLKRHHLQILASVNSVKITKPSKWLQLVNAIHEKQKAQ